MIILSFKSQSINHKGGFMDIVEMSALKRETEQHIIHLLDEFTSNTGLNVHGVNFTNLDVTAVTGSGEKEYINKIEIDIRL